jgi:hypothetical protein
MRRAAEACLAGPPVRVLTRLGQGAGDAAAAAQRPGADGPFAGGKHRR